MTDNIGRVLVATHHDATYSALKHPMYLRGLLVERAQNGSQAASMGSARTYDLIVLQDTLPDISGLSLGQQISQMSEVGLVVVSYDADAAARAMALEVYADDFWLLPLPDVEVTARALAVMRRSGRVERPSTLQVGDLAIDFDGESCSLNGDIVVLTPTEWRILQVLARYQGNHVPTDIVIAYVWGAGASFDAGSLRVHLSNLRRKIEPDRSNPRYILTKPGFGLALASV